MLRSGAVSGSASFSSAGVLGGHSLPGECSGTSSGTDAAASNRFLVNTWWQGGPRCWSYDDALDPSMGRNHAGEGGLGAALSAKAQVRRSVDGTMAWCRP